MVIFATLFLAWCSLPSFQEAARTMMDGFGDDGLVIDGRKLFFEYR